jgi:hypothetical protein
MTDEWTEEERALIARVRSEEIRKTLRTVCVCLTVIVLAGLAAWAVGAFQ